MAEHVDQRPQRGHRIRRQRRVLAIETIEDRPGRPAQIGQGVHLLAHPGEHLTQRATQIPLPPQPFDDLAGRATAGHVRNELPEEAIDSGRLGRPCLRQPLHCLVIIGPQPAAQPLQARLDRPYALALGGGLAERFDQSRSGRGGQTRSAQSSRIRPTWPIRIDPSASPSRPQRPVGQPDDLGIGGRPARAEQLDAQLGKLPVAAWPRRLEPEDRARHAHASGQGGTVGGLGISPHDAGGELRPQADLAGPSAGDLEQPGHDPRAALALVQLGELEDRRAHWLVARAPELVEQEPLERGQPGELTRQPVARAAYPADGPLERIDADRRGPDSAGSGFMTSVLPGGRSPGRSAPSPRVPTTTGPCLPGESSNHAG